MRKLDKPLNFELQVLLLMYNSPQCWSYVCWRVALDLGVEAVYFKGLS